MHALAMALALVQGALSVGPERKVLSPTPTTNRAFGLSVAAEGDRAIVTEAWSGSFAREFQRAGAGWNISSSTSLPSGFQTNALDMNFDWMVVGDSYYGLEGEAHVFRRVGGVWQHFQQLPLPHTVGFPEYYGHSVDVDGDRIAVGNPLDSEYGSAVYIWRRNSGFFSLEGVVSGAIPTSGNLGCGVALRGADLLVSSRTAVEHHRFLTASSSWTFQGVVLSGLSGVSVPSNIPLAISEEGVAVVGDPYASAGAGVVHILEPLLGSWSLRATLSASTPLPGVAFGSSVACRGPLIAVGAPGANAAELIVRNGGWQSAAVAVASDAQAGDRFGDALALATTTSTLQSTLLVGAPFHDSAGANAGAAYFFEIAHDAAVYCTSKVNSLGCLPRVEFSGVPSASSPAPFTISARSVLNQRNGVLFYGLSGPAAAPFQGGVKCVASPTRRTGTLNSAGTPPFANDCSGVYGFDFNAWIASGADPSLMAGASVCGQFWSRDPAASFGVGLSEAIEFLIQN